MTNKINSNFTFISTELVKQIQFRISKHSVSYLIMMLTSFEAEKYYIINSSGSYW